MALKFPKPTPRKKVKAKAWREDVKHLARWRDAIWDRESALAGGCCRDSARCQSCGEWVNRTIPDQFGECHHRIGRRAKATRYDPTNGVLLCQSCHRKVTEHQIPCP